MQLESCDDMTKRLIKKKKINEHIYVVKFLEDDDVRLKRFEEDLHDFVRRWQGITFETSMLNC